VAYSTSGIPGLSQITPWIQVAPDDSVIIYLSQTEVGQGIYTGLAQILAEELDADWGKIRLAEAPIRAPYEMTLRGATFQGTQASTSIALIGPAMKTAGAAARAMLRQAGANQWSVSVSEVTTDAGFVVHASTRRRLSYGALSHAAAKLPVPSNPVVRQRSEYRYVGFPVKRFDTPFKTNGSAVFGIDVRVPGMLYAAIANIPVFGAKILGTNADVVKAMPGVKAVVPAQDLVMVVADSFWQAKKAAEALEFRTNEAQINLFSTQAFSGELRAAMDGPGALPSGTRGRGAVHGARTARTPLLDSGRTCRFGRVLASHTTADLQSHGLDESTWDTTRTNHHTHNVRRGFFRP
jgi:isoquinoline 1-oxidoreductase beta subunit